MPKFSDKSLTIRATLDPRLQRFVDTAIQTYDITLISGKRTVGEQEKRIKEGKSKTLHSKHVWPIGQPSLAVDLAPYPVVWPEPPGALSGMLLNLVMRYVRQVGRFYHLAGYLSRVAEEHGFAVRWGGDWDGDLDFTDQKWDDLPHYEILEGGAQG